MCEGVPDERGAGVHRVFRAQRDERVVADELVLEQRVAVGFLDEFGVLAVLAQPFDGAVRVPRGALRVEP